MDFNIIDIEPDSVTIELDNEECYELTEAVKVALDGAFIGEFKKNVFTVGGLTQGSKHEITVTEKNVIHSSKTFITAKESVRLDVRDFGAKGDAVSKDTAFIQAAINACPKDGTVYFGKGTYLSGPLFLKSDIRIFLDEGAVLLGLTDRSEYPILPGIVRTSDEQDEFNLGSWEGNPLDSFASLITGIDIENVSIYGTGSVNGNAASADWWKDPKVRRGAWRPRLVYLCRCKNVTLQGIELCNSPAWNLHPYYSDNINIISLRINNPADSPNTDGIDPDSCSNVNIIGTDISVGDDCIAIKSGKYYMALKHHKPTDGVTVRNCKLNFGHGSVTVGSECAGGVKNVHVSRCIFNGTDRGLRIKTRRGRGRRSVLEDILFENIRMIDVRMPFTVNMFYFCDPDGHSEYCQCKDPLPVDDLTPSIRSITARNIECTGADACVLTVYGLPEQKVQLVSLENIKASFRPESERKAQVPVMMDGFEPVSGRGVIARNVSTLSLKNVTIEGSVDKEADAVNTDRIIAENVTFC